jgi:hypothetical protein
MDSTPQLVEFSMVIFNLVHIDVYANYSLDDFPAVKKSITGLNSIYVGSRYCIYSFLTAYRKICMLVSIIVNLRIKLKGNRDETD